MKVINLIGGPGCGKSTTAAGLFYELKKKGYSVELVTEYAKTRVWEDALKTLKDQIYVFGKQHHSQWKLEGKVDYIVTDSSLLFSIIYGGDQVTEAFESLVIEDFRRFNNVCIFLERTGIDYERNGRLETSQEAEEIDKRILRLVDKYKIPITRISSLTAVQEVLNLL